MMTPNSELQQDIQARLVKTGLGAALAGSTPVIAMHVRQGDACSDGFRTGRSCSPLSDYMTHAIAARASTGANTIYLATDSEAILEQTANYPDWTFLRSSDAADWAKQLKTESADATNLYDPTTKSQEWDNVMRYNVKSGKADSNRKTAWETTIDIHLLSLCDIFVGKHTSNFFRTAYELHAGRCNCAAPFVSLDAPWCFDWGVKAGHSSDGDGKGFMC